MSLDATRIPQAVWGASFEEFIGLYAIDDRLYGFNGRHEDNSIHFEADFAGHVLWTSPDGFYTVRPTKDPDWEPSPTMLLVRDGSEVVGFYAGGMLWIDDAHRGRGIAPWLVLAGCVEAGRVPRDNSQIVGFSEAGIAAHRAAHRIAVDLALQAGLPVPERVTGEYAQPTP
jgi:GNAT superfamily N-acetyltransferase